MATTSKTTLMSAASQPAKKRFDIRRIAKRHPNMAIGFVLITIIVLMSICAPLIMTHSPTHQVPAERLKPPFTGEYWLGTDGQGRDLYSRTIKASQVSLFVGAVVALLTITVGGLIGLLCGTIQKFDTIVMRIMDGMLAFPSIILAIAIMAVRGPAISNVIFALAIVNLPTAARVVRSVVLGIAEGQFVEAAKAMGASRGRILFKHIAINSLSPAIVQTSIVFAQAILSEASLSFLGAGIPTHIPSWGVMLSDSRVFLANAPWTMLVPGAALTITVFALNLIGDGIRDMLDPRLRNR